MDSDAGSVSSRASSPEMDIVGPRSLASRHNKLFQDFLSDQEEQGSDRPPKARLDSKSKSNREVPGCESQELRLKVNYRERKRMQDLNVAMDGLREVMPYAHGPSVRKLSKIATLLLARNYILMLSGSLEEMKRLVSEVHGGPAHFHPPRCGGQLGLQPQPQPLRPVATPPPSLPIGFLGIGRAAAAAAAELLKGSAQPPAVPTLSGAYRHWGEAACPCNLCQTGPQHLPGGHTANLSRPSTNK